MQDGQNKQSQQQGTQTRNIQQRRQGPAAEDVPGSTKTVYRTKPVSSFVEVPTQPSYIIPPETDFIEVYERVEEVKPADAVMEQEETDQLNMLDSLSHISYDDLQRSIIMSEVLGKPKALRNRERRVGHI
jgi:hypothetical protein